MVAAGVAFFGALAVVPALIIAVSVYGIFTDPSEAESHVAALLDVMPDETARALEAQIHPIADFSHFHLTIGLVVAALALLWTTSNASRAMVRAVCIAAGQTTGRSSLERRLAAVGLTLVVILVVTAAIGMIAAVPVWLSFLDPNHVVVNFGNLRWALLALLVGAGTAALYRSAPPNRPESWSLVMPGALLATGLWLVISIGFSVYVSSFANYNETYGALGAGAVLLLWLWLSALSLIVGAQFNAVRADVRRRSL